MPETHVGNDGLTTVEREEFAHRHQTAGAGRPLTAKERDAVRTWLQTRQQAREGT